jgi:hypothetical protein
MKTKKNHEGYMLIDHLFSPGLPEPVRIPGLPTVVAPGGKIIEAAIICCRHCQVEMIKNPERTRPRGYCTQCDHYICDRCEGLRILYGCTTIEKVIEQIQEEAARNLNIKEL